MNLTPDPDPDLVNPAQPTGEEMTAKPKKPKSKKRDAEIVDLRKVPKDQRPKPSTGQSAEERKLPYDSLSADEKTIIKLLNGKGQGARVTRSIEFLAEALDTRLVARNALRRPVSCGWVDNVGRGQYTISEKGRKRLLSV